MSTITLPAATIVPCDDRCMFAKSDDCDCQCGGVNHKQGSKLTAVQRTIPRTRVGRRIPVLTQGTWEWDLAWAAYEMREEQGMTQREIAAEMLVSAPTVRRMIKSVLVTLEIAEAQAEEHANA
jgi:hypothetical protein